MLLLPKKNLSHSQISLWNKTTTHRDYIKRYFFNEPQFLSKELLFGRMIADELKKDNLFDVPDWLSDVFHALPVDGFPEVPVVVQRKGFYTLSYLDRCSKDYDRVIEFKTGKNEWTHEMVENDRQLDFYAWSIWSNFKVIPEIELVWMETKDDPESEYGISLTGRVERFKKLPCSTIEQTEDYINRTAIEISEGYTAFLNGEDLAAKYNWR